MAAPKDSHNYKNCASFYRSSSAFINSLAPSGPLSSIQASLLSPLTETVKVKKPQHSLSVLIKSANSSTTASLPSNR